MRRIQRKMSRKTDNWAVEYLVVDKSCRMDEETRVKIFQSFFKHKREYRGAGLGLMFN
jgi:signal transduction histidine kinase